MVSEIVDGKIPWYGVFGNGAKSIKNTITRKDGSSYENFIYIPSWTVKLGGDNLHIVVKNNRIEFYTYDENRMTKYNHAQYEYNSSYIRNKVVGSVEHIDNFVYYIEFQYNNYDDDDISYLYSNMFVKDTGDMLFIRNENEIGISELIISSDGYIQYKTTSVNNYIAIYTRDIITPILDGYNKEYCSECTYFNMCKYTNNGTENEDNTSCNYNITYVDWNRISRDWDSEFLLEPNNEIYSHEILSNKHINNTGLNVSNGEIFINKITDNTYKDVKRVIPLYNTPSTENGVLSLSTRVNNVNKYIYLYSSGMINYNDTYYKDAILNLRYNKADYRNKMNRSSSKNIQSMVEPVTTFSDDKSGNYNNVLTTSRVYTYGSTSTSTDNHYWTNVPTLYFGSSISVSKITIAMSFESADMQGYHNLPRECNNDSSKVHNKFILYYTYTPISDYIHTQLSTSKIGYYKFEIPKPYHHTYFLTLDLNLKDIQQIVIVPYIENYSEYTEINDEYKDTSKVPIWYYNDPIRYIVMHDLNNSTNSFTYEL